MGSISCSGRKQGREGWRKEKENEKGRLDAYEETGRIWSCENQRDRMLKKRGPLNVTLDVTNDIDKTSDYNMLVWEPV